MTYLSITEYAELVLELKNNPHELADLGLILASKYSLISDIAKDLQIEKAVFTNNEKFKGEKPLSDAAVNAKWLLEEGGRKEIKIRYELKALEKLLSAIKSSTIMSNFEARNDY